MYNKQQWLDEIPDMSRPILDGSGKQKTDPQTGRPLFELVQAGTRITSARLNTMEGGIEGAHVLIEQLAKELAGNFVAVIDGVMGLQCSTQGLTASWTAGVAYVGGRRFEVSAGNMTLNPTQGQYLYVDADGTVKKTTSQATAKAGVLLFYVATDASGVITSTDQRVNISLEEILMKLENIDVPDASLTQKGIVQLSNATNGTRENVAATEKAVKAAYDRGSAGVTAAATAQTRADSAFTEATAAKQLGVEQKANVVAALNSIGVTASTNDTWAQLVAKMAGVIRATGSATAADLLSGRTASNASGPFTGTMPNRGAVSQTITTQNGSYNVPAGYHNGSGVIRAAFANLIASNIRAGVNVGGVVGSLVEGKRFATGQFYTYGPTTTGGVNNLAFNPKIIVLGLYNMGDSYRFVGVYSSEVLSRGTVINSIVDTTGSGRTGSFTLVPNGFTITVNTNLNGTWDFIAFE